MTLEHILTMVDHTLLLQGSTWEEIRNICDQGMRFHTASICIPPCYVKRASEYMGRKLPITTVIGFPNGNMTTAAKVFEAKDAIANGAEEIDMVINIGELKAGNDSYVLNEINEVKAVCGPHLLKVIIECCLLTQEEKIRMCRIVTESDADYIKTSTGFSSGGATFEDVKLMAEHIGPNIKIKAAGGIASVEDAEKFISLGASRLGTSRLVKIALEQG
ncbi:deoxyribose-phosphate aldolase [[Clostridium] aminophilum]|uniref:Deoxyribose-phosphate aldolase n=1 Tax=[Clostridium] aminophilum TaxID=1526 RepID=A0A1I6JZF3_9FIRM|nr:deoxyribose-phosphate aldolase [[Clostridium] aminophilum]SFR84347.1 deoxyribose-phosphate aldolase [[Clostridium] aminophilum]